MSFVDFYFKSTCIFLIIVAVAFGIGLIVYGIIKAFKSRKLPICLECKHLSQYKGSYGRYTCTRNWTEHFSKAPKYCKYFEPFIPVNKTVTISSDGLQKTIVITQEDD